MKENKKIQGLKTLVIIIVTAVLGITIYTSYSFYETDDFIEKVELAIKGELSPELVEEYHLGYFTPIDEKREENKIASFERKFVLIRFDRGCIEAVAMRVDEDKKTKAILHTSRYDLTIPIAKKNDHWYVCGKIGGAY